MTYTDKHENTDLIRDLEGRISLPNPLFNTKEVMRMRKILAHYIRIQKYSQTKEDTFWIFTDFHRVMRVQNPTCNPARNFHQWHG